MTHRIETETLQALRKAASEATGDPARYPRRGITDQYHGALVAAYEDGELVPIAEVLESRTVIDHLGDLLAWNAALADARRDLMFEEARKVMALKTELATARAEIERQREYIAGRDYEC